MGTNVLETNCRLYLQSRSIVWLRLVLSSDRLTFLCLVSTAHRNNSVFPRIYSGVTRFKVDVICCFVTSVSHIVVVMRQRGGGATGGGLSIFINNMEQALQQADSAATRAKNSCTRRFTLTAVTWC